MGNDKPSGRGETLGHRKAQVDGGAHHLALGAAPDAPVLRSAVRAELADTVERLGVGRWVQRWWPAASGSAVPAIDLDLIDLELAALSWYGEALTVTTDPIAALLAPRTSRLVELAGSWLLLDPRWQAPRLAADVVFLALRAAVDVLGPDADDATALETVLARVEAEPEAAFERPEVSWAELFAGDARRGLAVARGVSRPVADVVGRSTVDWIRVPPRVVTAEENNVSWRLRRLAEGGQRVEVEVRAAAGATTDEPLAAEVETVSGPTTIDLVRRGDRYTGWIDLDTELVDPAVDVRGTGSWPLARRSAAGRARARADRDLVRRLVTDRLAATDRWLADGGGREPLLAEVAVRAVSHRAGRPW